MLITRESDYAVRIIRALKDKELLTIQEICELELVPKQFAYKILKKLEKAGLVLIRRGAGGGCTLGRPLSDITLYDIMLAVEEEFAIIHCLQSGAMCEYRNRTGICTVHGELARVQKILEEELGRHSMEELLNSGKTE